MSRRERGKEVVEKEPVFKEDKEEVNRLLGALGLYDASQDQYDTPEYEDDNKWIGRSNN